VDHQQVLEGLRGGALVEAVITPAEDANGWVLILIAKSGEHLLYTGHTGTEKVYHSLDQVTEVARELGFNSVRVEESF
jgi:hypothetical protein